MSTHGPLFISLADTFHKPGLKLHTKILHLLFRLAGPGGLDAPLWDTAKEGPAAYAGNAAFLRAHLTTMLTNSFPNMTPHQIEVRWGLNRAGVAVL